MSNSENRKQKGIRGSSSKATIAKRHEIMTRVYCQNEWKDKTDFIKLCRKAVNDENKKSINKIKFPTSSNTLKKDFKECGFDFEHPEQKKSIISSPITKVFQQIFRNIRQIRVVCGTTDVVLYDNMYKRNIYKRTKRVIEEVMLLGNAQKMNGFPLVHLYIILTSEIENKLIDVYLKEYSSILYATAHFKCVEVVFQSNSIKRILKETSRAIKFIIESQKIDSIRG